MITSPEVKFGGIDIKDEDKILFTNETAIDSFDAREISRECSISIKKKPYNLEGIKKLLSDDYYYNQLLALMNNPKVAKYYIKRGATTIPIPNSDTTRTISVGNNISMAINKNNFIDLLYELLQDEKLDDIIDAKLKINTLAKGLSLDKIAKTMPTYTTTIVDKSYTVDTKAIIDFIKTKGLGLDFAKTPEFAGMDARHFLYIVNKFIDDAKLSSTTIIDPETVTFLKSIKEDSLLDTKSLDKINETKDPVQDVLLNPKLIQYVLDKMPENYTDLQKAIFVYLRLTRTLTYDGEFYADQQSDEANSKHSDIARLSTITSTENNNVVCYEFNKLYGLFLKLLGINYEVEYVLHSYGNGHANLTFKANDYIVKADSVLTILGSDMMTTKVNNDISGLVCQNPNAVMKQKFQTSLYSVYKDVQMLEPSDSVIKQYEQEDSFSRWSRLLDTFLDKSKEVSVKDRIDIYSQVVADSKLPPTEKVAYYTKIYNKLFKTPEGVPNTYMNIVSQRTPDPKNPEGTGVKMPTLLISYNTKGDLLDEENIEFMLLVGNEWIQLDRASAQAYFDSGKLGSLGHAVPGIQHKRDMPVRHTVQPDRTMNDDE